MDPFPCHELGRIAHELVFPGLYVYVTATFSEQTIHTVLKEDLGISPQEGDPFPLSDRYPLLLVDPFPLLLSAVDPFTPSSPPSVYPLLLSAVDPFTPVRRAADSPTTRYRPIDPSPSTRKPNRTAKCTRNVLVFPGLLCLCNQRDLFCQTISPPGGAPSPTYCHAHSPPPIYYIKPGEQLMT